MTLPGQGGWTNRSPEVPTNLKDSLIYLDIVLLICLELGSLSKGKDWDPSSNLHMKSQGSLKSHLWQNVFQGYFLRQDNRNQASPVLTLQIFDTFVVFSYLKHGMFLAEYIVAGVGIGRYSGK